MDVVQLRILTEKSTLKFGQYYDLTVRQVLTLYKLKGLRYLRWVYYNSSKISFNDEILTELGIEKGIRIEKPGKVATDKEYHEFYRRIKFIEFSQSEKRQMLKLSIRSKKQHALKTKRISGLVISKTYLKRKNLNR